MSACTCSVKPLHRRDDLLAPRRRGRRPAITLSPLSRRIFLPSSTLVPSSRTTSGTLQADLLDRGDDAFGDDVAAHDAAEDVDQDALDVRVGGDDLEGRRHLLLRGAAADVEEVRRLGAVELDDVHRRHGEAGAVDHAADIAVERDIGEIVFRGLDLLRVLLGDVAQLGDVRDGGTARCCRTMILASSTASRPFFVTISGLTSSRLMSFSTKAL